MSRKDEIRDDPDYPSDPHTRVKHEFYRRYINCWMPKLLQGRYARDVTIVDAFAGSGRYKDGLDGSAVMIAKLFREHQFRDRFRTLDFVTLEKDPRRVELLNERIGQLPDDLNFIHSAQPAGEFESEWRRILDEHAPAGRPTLWILDPWGFQIPWSAVRACAVRPKNEVIITLMLDELHRYLHNPTQEATLNSIFGGDSWKSIPQGLPVAESKSAIVRLYRAKLEELGCHTGAFDVQVRGETGRYALIFGTHHPIGLQCWNAATWSLDPGAGRGASASPQLGFDFGPDVGRMVAHIEDLAGRVVGFSTLTDWAVREGFLESHVRTALDALFDEGRVLRIHPLGSRTPWPGDCRVQVFEASADG